MTARILGIDYALPERVVTNAELAAAHPAWRMPDVALRTGVLERRMAAADETALDLGVRASESLLERIGVRRDEVDAVLFCTQTPDYPLPPNACLLQARLGLPRGVAALDFTLACSGFIYGLWLARSLVDSRSARRVLLVTADTYSTLIGPGDRAAATLFGDGGAATLVGPGERGLDDFVLGTDGAAAECFIVPAGGARQPRSATTVEPRRDRSGNVRSAEQIRMDGAGVLAFVQREVPRAVRELLARTHLTLDDVDLVIFHQASRTALDHLNAVLEVPAGKRFENIERLGNTVSASLPIALRDAELAGRLRPGSRVLLVGFGVGLSWGCALVTV